MNNTANIPEGKLLVGESLAVLHDEDTSTNGEEVREGDDDGKEIHVREILDILGESSEEGGEGGDSVKDGGDNVTRLPKGVLRNIRHDGHVERKGNRINATLNNG